MVDNQPFFIFYKKLYMKTNYFLQLKLIICIDLFLSKEKETEKFDLDLTNPYLSL